jgi:hypothetical protein
MVTSIVLWAVVLGTPRPVAVYVPGDMQTVAVVAELEGVRRCNQAAQDLKWLGVRAWCVPQTSL